MSKKKQVAATITVFNSPEFEGIKNEAGRNSFYLSAKSWIERTGAVGVTAKAGRYGGTLAYKDIAFEFGSWLSPEFKLYLIMEFQRLKNDENRRLSLAWNLNQIAIRQMQTLVSHPAIKQLPKSSGDAKSDAEGMP